MTYDARETSTQSGQPVELYTFSVAMRTYRYTSAEEPVSYGGYDYEQLAGLGRGPVVLMQAGKSREMEIALPRTHAIALVLTGNGSGIPPRTATLTVRRLHRSDAEARLLWSGAIAQVRIDGSYLRLRVPNGADAALDVGLPFARVSGTCQHILYGPGCEVVRDYATYKTQGYLVATTAVSQTSAGVLTVADMNNSSGAAHANQWARYGEVRRVVDGERRTVLDHTGTALTLDVPFGTIFAGDDLEVYAGCDHQIGTCGSKFGNGQKFGGHPSAPSSNPMNIQGND